MAQAAIFGFDTATTLTDAALKRAQAKGVQFVCVYFKYMTPEIVALINRYGMKVVSVYETTAQRALGGTVAGDYDGRQSLAYIAKFKQPPGAAVFATADFDETTAQEPTVAAYLRAFKAALGGAARLGIYGNGALCAMALDAGIADLTWLAGGSGMRGTRDFAASGRATMVQDVGDKRNLALGISIDSDIALVDDYGGWALAAAAPSVPDAEDPIATTIRQLQTELTAVGLYAGEVDADPGPKTLNAITAWRNARE